MKDQVAELTTNIEKINQQNTKKIKEIEKKIKNNDYNECQENNHDKMTLENRKMTLENKISLNELIKDNAETKKDLIVYMEKNQFIIGEIIKEISKNYNMDAGSKERIFVLLSKLKPKKLTLNTGILKAEW